MVEIGYETRQKNVISPNFQLYKRETRDNAMNIIGT